MAQKPKDHIPQEQYDEKLLTPLSLDDQQFLKSIPEIKIPETRQGRFLPAVVDNSTRPWFRPVFSQASLDCGQSSGVGFNFTYEINRKRDVPGNVPTNQYPTHFVYNWSNNGGAMGVSFYDSWTIIRQCGTPTVQEYGGMATGGTSRWMTGYDLYYSAMKNRLSNIYSIPVGTPEGINTLKHWINDHLNGEESGGLASFYAQYMSVSTTLPPGTPEAGKYVITDWGSSPNHSMCIVGYHDSICFDFNNDGQYTNHLDIDNNGVVDVRDWEIGGLKFANSYGGGPNWGNNGFCYMMYNVLGSPLGSGGIWNQAVYVVDARASTEPQLTYKIKLKHDLRNQIKVTVGVSTDPNAQYPSYVLDFPIFNYQGGAYYMTGGTAEEDKVIEFGLDVTPLLNFIQPGQEARFFLLVNERDPDNTGTGEVQSWSVMDYTNGLSMISYPQNNIPLTENGLTLLSLNTAIDFIPVTISTEQLTPGVVNDPYSFQMDASGGNPDYHWDLRTDYNLSSDVANMPMVNAQQLNPYSTTSGWAMKEIPFPFPFYGKEYSKIYVHVDGYIMFREDIMPWPYIVDEYTFFKNTRCIAPYMAKPLVLSSGDGMWYESGLEYVTIRWKSSVYDYTGTTDLNYAVRLHYTGKIEFFYGNIETVPWMFWTSGISDGTMEDYHVTGLSNTYGFPPNTRVTFESGNILSDFSITDEGELQGTPSHPYEAVPIKVQVTDQNGLSAVKYLPFTTDGINSIVFRSTMVESGGDNIIEPGETVNLGVVIENLGAEIFNNALITLHNADGLISLTDSTQLVPSITPGQMVTLENAFQFTVSEELDNNHPIDFTTQVDANGEVFNSHIYLTGYAPFLIYQGFSIDDGNNGLLDPGETADMSVSIFNAGGGKSYNLSGNITCSDPFITLNTTQQNIALVNPQQAGNMVFNFTCSPGTPFGHAATLYFTASDDYGNQINKTIVVTIGYVIENFESGNFNTYNWEFSGDAPWSVVTENPYEGEYCMKSGVITHNQTSSVNIEVDVTSLSQISFHYKVSSESNYDFLIFAVDGQSQGSWSGTVGWSQAVFTISPGLHTLTWTYLKDYSVNAGSDCAWVDNILFPAASNLVFMAFAGPDITICENETCSLINSVAANAASVNWTTSGDGTFDNSQIIHPVYTPGLQDITNGVATLTLSATGSSGSTILDDMLLTIHRIPVVSAGNDQETCADVVEVPVSGTVNYSNDFLWATSGDGYFVDPASLETNYILGVNDIQSGNVTITLTADGMEPCGDSYDQLLLTVHPNPEVQLADFPEFCTIDPIYVLMEGTPDGGTYSGNGVSNGYFSPSLAGPGFHLITYTFTDENGCSGIAENTIHVLDCTSLPDIDQKSPVQIYPNPADDEVFIKLSGISGSMEIMVENPDGKVVMIQSTGYMATGAIFSLSLSALQTGIYILIVKSSEFTYRTRLIVIH